MTLAPSEGVVGVLVAVLVHATQVQEGLGTGDGPAHAGEIEAVLDQVAAGALDHAGGDGPAAREVGGIVHGGRVALQVGGDFGERGARVARAAGRVGELAQVGHKRGALAAQELERALCWPFSASVRRNKSLRLTDTLNGQHKGSGADVYRG